MSRIARPSQTTFLTSRERHALMKAWCLRGPLAIHRFRELLCQTTQEDIGFSDSNEVLRELLNDGLLYVSSRDGQTFYAPTIEAREGLT